MRDEASRVDYLSEKRIRQLPAIRISDSLEIALLRLAARDERSLSDYVWRVLERHVFGHVISLSQLESVRNESHAAQSTSTVEGMR